MKKITLIIVAAACVACGMTRENRENETCGETTATSAVCDITPHTRGDQEANAPWIAHLETLKPALAKQNEIDVYFKYSEPIGVYEVTMLWQPFYKDCETGLAIINLRDTTTGISMQIVDEEKYNSYHTDTISFAEGFEGYKDGDIFIIDSTTPAQPDSYESTIDYYMPLQLIDVDFDGEKELLISDWGQCQQGNSYEVYDITNNGLVLKTQPPYNEIDNCTKFDYDKKQIEVFTHGGIFYSDTKVYEVKNNIARLLAEYEFALHTADGFDGWYDVRLKMSKNSKSCFEGIVGRVQSLSYDVENFYPVVEDGILSAPDDLLFFADIDFDGVCELITGITPFAGSQRDCSAFTTIYKLVDGRYKDMSKNFVAKCEVFEAIEPHYFSINYSSKEIIQYHDGGAMSGGWEVYVYANGKYRYDRYVHFDHNIKDDMVDRKSVV